MRWLFIVWFCLEGKERVEQPREAFSVTNDVLQRDKSPKPWKRDICVTFAGISDGFRPKTGSQDTLSFFFSRSTACHTFWNTSHKFLQLKDLLT
jgi:hypothetical protein